MNHSRPNEAGHDASPTPFVPPLERTAGQPPPIAANGGLSYMSFDRGGDAGTAAALEDALAQIATGEGQAIIDLLDNAPPGPIDTRWGPGFRRFAECLASIRDNDQSVPEGGLAVPLRYSIYEQPSYSVVSSNALWRDPAREADAHRLRQDERENVRRCLYFPQILRDARRIGEHHDGLSPTSPECMDRLGVALAHCESKCRNFYDAAEVEAVFYPEMERLLLDFFPDATDALVYNHDVFDKELPGRSNRRPGQQEPRRERRVRQSGSQRSERQQRSGSMSGAVDPQPSQFRPNAEFLRGRSRRKDVPAASCRSISQNRWKP